MTITTLLFYLDIGNYRAFIHTYEITCILTRFDKKKKQQQKKYTAIKRARAFIFEIKNNQKRWSKCNYNY